MSAARSSQVFPAARAAATAAAVVASKKSAPAASGKGKRATVGYHVTEHVNNYYRTAKV